jgi:hypothetical protein
MNRRFFLQCSSISNVFKSLPESWEGRVRPAGEGNPISAVRHVRTLAIDRLDISAYDLNRTG